MEELTHYFTIEKASTAEFKDRGSKFIAYAYPINSKDEFKKYLQHLKKAHPKAVHHCFAYRIGFDGNNFRVSDDGEPSGTAGKPILGQIDGKNVTNVLIIVVRYFGGTLLGVPGLINAYKTASSMALQLVPIIKKEIEIIYKLQFDYTLQNDVMLILRQNNCSIINQRLQLFCEVETGIPKKKLQIIMQKLQKLYGVTVEKRCE